MAFTLLDRKEATKALDALTTAYKDAHYYLAFNTDVDLLAAAMLSAQTRDEVTNSVTTALFKRFKTVDDYAQADEK